VAIDYIWKRFVETTISETAFADGRVESIQKKPVTQAFNPNSESHLKFESKVRENHYIENQYSFMKF
jgi:hypothetical protein